MRTFDERRNSVEQHIKKIRKKKKVVTSLTSITLVVAILALVLFVPFNNAPPSDRQYRNNAYYNLIQKINLATYEAPKYDNLFENIVYGFMGTLNNSDGLKGEIMEAPMQGTMAATPAMPDSNGTAGEYVEVTDNQVAGVIESDIFKRSTEYIYYLRGRELSVYSIAKEDSALVGTFTLEETQLSDGESEKLHSVDCLEMYLSMDCRTITVITSVYRESTGTCVEVINLDVSDAENIAEINRVCMTGAYLSSRMVDGQLLVMSRYRISGDVDFDDPTTFVPQVGTEEEMEPVAPEKIASPETLSHLTYTVICAIDAETLDVNDSAAVLSFSEELYVSQDTVYATRTFTEQTEKDAEGNYCASAVTEITGIRYSGDKLELTGSITLEGSVKDQYSMDQHEGILRVVTSTTKRSYREWSDDEFASVGILGTERNVNLYCVDLENWEIAASVIGFAPDGEDAQSVRFDGDKAYVCTAMVITMTDPVYFFDLSDLSNITWTDTGTIDGYSTSLIQLGDGFLLGIGYGDEMQLKIEVYEEVDGKVVSVCAYEMDATFSEEYKTYYIDRENDLIGLPVRTWDGEAQYILLHFDGYDLNVRSTVTWKGSLVHVRATIIDGYLYVLSDLFTVQQVW